VKNALIRSLFTGFSRPLILWLIKHKPRCGYVIMRELRRLTGERLGPGTVYPLLQSLEEGGYIIGDWVKRRRRKIKRYSITSRGEKALKRIHELFETPFGEALMFLLESGEGSRE